MNKENPWKTIDSKEIYKNPWIRVREDQVIKPDGGKGIYSVVETRIATGVLALTESKEVVLVGQYRYPLHVYSWEIVEGGSDESEAPIETAKRELLEEAGLIAKKWSPLGGVIHLSNCFSAEEAYLFLAEELENAPHEPDPNEILEIMSVPFAKAYDMVMKSEITDAMSIIAILRAKQELSL